MPIPKKSNACGSFEDFRPATSVSTLAKLFKYFLLQKLEKYAGFHDLLLGVTEGGGCDKALFILRTVLEYFNKYATTAFITMLEISKAHDRLNQC